MNNIVNNFANYLENEQIKTHYSFEEMADFIETLSDSYMLKDYLIYALNRMPFRKFNFVIDNSGNYRQKGLHSLQ